jgi:putative FmdB family regulatory protein
VKAGERRVIAMPTYEYRCLSCDYYFEKFQSVNDEPVKVCPKCGGEVRKLISTGAGLIFRGSGFYITDYKRNGNSSGGNGKASESSDSSSKSKSQEKSEVKSTSSK